MPKNTADISTKHNPNDSSVTSLRPVLSTSNGATPRFERTSNGTPMPTINHDTTRRVRRAERVMTRSTVPAQRRSSCSARKASHWGSTLSWYFS